MNRPSLATDFSPTVLRRTQWRWQTARLAGRVSLLACVARWLPLRDGAISILTINLGLPNIAQPGPVLRELRRIVGGTFLAISYFYPEANAANRAAVEATGGGPLLYRRTALEQLAAAGWQVELARVCTGAARPTTRCILRDGATMEGLPVADTVLEWCVLVAR